MNNVLSKIKNNNLMKKNLKGFLIIIFIILVLYFIIFSIINGTRKRTCNELRNDIIKQADIYFDQNNLLPNYNGEQNVINLNELDNSIIFKDYAVTGTITYTKYNDQIIKTLNISNAGYCNTKDFGKETDEYKEDKNVEVVTYYNYSSVETYNSKWSNWYPSEDINTEETNGVLLPIDEDKLPSIPKNAVVNEYVRETKTYYSYRDKKWRFYKNNIDYSDYSSTQPKGYQYKDTATLKKSESSDWSLNYPTTYDYRHITQKTGYRWYYLEEENKIYWNNGEYSVDSPGENYIKDNQNSALMYSYYDDTWRWYNGDTKRIYSSLSSTMPSGYKYKDETTLTYTNWSSFKDESSITADNKNYREEKTDTYSRYMIKYDIYSLPMLNDYVTKEELEDILGKSLQEINNDETLHLNVLFKFKYE